MLASLFYHAMRFIICCQSDAERNFQILLNGDLRRPQEAADSGKHSTADSN